MGKATEILKYLEAHPLTPEELERRDGPRPALQLLPEIVAQALNPTATVQEALDRTAGQTTGELTTLHNSETGTTAIVVPVEQYLEFVSSYIRDRRLATVAERGWIGPSSETLRTLGVAQVNPRDSWVYVEGYDPTAPPQ